MDNQRQSESKKYYIPLPKTEDAPTGYIEFYRDFQFVEVIEEVYRTYYQPISPQHLKPRQPLIYFMSLSICLFWKFFINEVGNMGLIHTL